MAKSLQQKPGLLRSSSDKAQNEAGLDVAHLELAQKLLAQRTIKKTSGFKLPATAARKLTEDPEIIKKKQQQKEAAIKEVLLFFKK